MRSRLPGLLAFAGAVLLPVSLSLDWYTLKVQASISVTGWKIFETVDALLVMVSLVVLFWLLPPTRKRIPDWALAVTGAVATIVVLVQIVQPPPLLSYVSADVTREIGAWLGLLGSVLVLVAGLLHLAARRRPPA